MDRTCTHIVSNLCAILINELKPLPPFFLELRQTILCSVLHATVLHSKNFPCVTIIIYDLRIRYRILMLSFSNFYPLLPGERAFPYKNRLHLLGTNDNSTTYRRRQ
jgi:hypothetical protein